MQVSSGVLTLLFTDIEGSTRSGSSSRSRCRRRSRSTMLLRGRPLKGNHGLIVKTTGDGMYAAFEDPADAVQPH